MQSRKNQAKQLFNDLGMNVATAFNIFLGQAVRQQRIPFDIALEIPNAETIAAMKEAERISRETGIDKSKLCLFHQLSSLYFRFYLQYNEIRQLLPVKSSSKLAQ